MGEGCLLGAFTALLTENVSSGGWGFRAPYKGRAMVSSRHRVRNCWQALEGVFDFLWCLRCPRVKRKGRHCS